jgi:hypothetical protein
MCRLTPDACAMAGSTKPPRVTVCLPARPMAFRSDATDAWPRPPFLQTVHSGGGVLSSYVPARPNLSFGRLDLNAVQPNSRSGSLTARSVDSLFSEILSGRSGAHPILWGQPAPTTDVGTAPLPSARTAPAPPLPSSGRGGRVGPTITPRRSTKIATDSAPPHPPSLPASVPDDAPRGWDMSHPNDLTRTSVTTAIAAATTSNTRHTSVSTSHTGLSRQTRVASPTALTPTIFPTTPRHPTPPISIGRSSARQSPVPSVLTSRPPTRHTPTPAPTLPVATPLQPPRIRRQKPKKKYVPGLQSWPWPEQGPPRVPASLIQAHDPHPRAPRAPPPPSPSSSSFSFVLIIIIIITHAVGGICNACDMKSSVCLASTYLYAIYVRMLRARACMSVCVSVCVCVCMCVCVCVCGRYGMARRLPSPSSPFPQNANGPQSPPSPHRSYP